AVLYIVSQKDKGAYKTAWAILILTFPLFGGLMYLLSNAQSSKWRFAKSVLHTAMRTKSWTGKGQECTHTRNGCEQSKHTSHPDIKRTRRSRSWDTHLTRRCVA